MRYLNQIGVNAKKAFEKLNKVKHTKIKKVLESYNKSILSNKNLIIRENLKDIKNSKRKKFVDRLMLNDNRIEGIRNSINEIVKFKNPLNQTLTEWKRPNGLIIKKVSTPIGVIGVIYESRPNVTADVSALCFKSGNCAILRGGSEAYYSNKILAKIFRDSLQKHNIDKNIIQFIESKNRSAVDYLLSKMTNYIDVIVPRGGKSLVEKVQKYSKVHVIGHLEGLCHIYVDNKSSSEMAAKIILNAKMRRTSICGAVETVLLNEKCLKTHAQPIITKLILAKCEVLVDKKINKIFKNRLKLAKEIDWKTEYLDAKLSIKSVKDVNEAIKHIRNYGTMHTDCIITNKLKIAETFLNGVNSSIAIHNASTQFADGGEFGFGGEIGISTNKLPPRGPVGINQLTSYKYKVFGKGTIRS
ncbi:glutamate-5-semialdehyde dehydrogenase [Pelagibacteraceae bacterium]|jgi:glutamate-5-semialdehyde dehydrogenase|nr:glutamate-5-semialdehyde dehydrogenase [Pelagibacteraceae bacterium]|tara:strand:+ start:2450 stop:3691 length:1242 start_codon:yes stop_codon:yes gene_type:complete